MLSNLTITLSVLIVLFTSLSGAYAQDNSRYVPYADAVRICGTEWRASDAKKNTAKGEGQKAWNEFRAQCVVREGYVKGRKAPKSVTN
jgi:hypothetical protein